MDQEDGRWNACGPLRRTGQSLVATAVALQLLIVEAVEAGGAVGDVFFHLVGGFQQAYPLVDDSICEAQGSFWILPSLPSD